MPVNYAQNSDAYIADLLNPDKGYVLIQNYFSDAEIDQYRTECENFLHTGPVVVSRINTDWIPDYVHPRSHDKVGRTYRIYQYLHNTIAHQRPHFSRKHLVSETRSRKHGSMIHTTDPKRKPCRTTSSSRNTLLIRDTYRLIGITTVLRHFRYCNLLYSCRECRTTIPEEIFACVPKMESP